MPRPCLYFWVLIVAVGAPAYGYNAQNRISFQQAPSQKIARMADLIQKVGLPRLPTLIRAKEWRFVSELQKGKPFFEILGYEALMASPKEAFVLEKKSDYLYVLLEDGRFAYTVNRLDPRDKSEIVKHPYLARGGKARMAGEIRWVKSHWIFDDDSGRYCCDWEASGKLIRKHHGPQEVESLGRLALLYGGLGNEVEVQNKIPSSEGGKVLFSKSVKN